MYFKILSSLLFLSTPFLSAELSSEMFNLLPADAKIAYQNDTEGFETLLKEVLQSDPYFWKLVDKSHPLPSNYIPKDLVNLDTLKEITTTKKGLFLRKEAALALPQMIGAAKKEGLKLLAASCYRSYQDQAYIFKREIELYGLEQAKRESAEAGKSQHQLGLAVDFFPIDIAFDKKPEAKWLLENAYKYGFVISYPEGYETETGYMHESWHFRFMGLKAAEFVQTYFGGIQQFALIWLDQFTKK